MSSAALTMAAVTAASNAAGGFACLFQLDHVPDDGGDNGQKQQGDQNSTHKIILLKGSVTFRAIVFRRKPSYRVPVDTGVFRRSASL